MGKPTRAGREGMGQQRERGPQSHHVQTDGACHPSGRQARPRSRRDVWAGLEMPDWSIWPHQRFRLGGVDAVLGGSRPRHTPGG